MIGIDIEIKPDGGRTASFRNVGSAAEDRRALAEELRALADSLDDDESYPAVNAHWVQ